MNGLLEKAVAREPITDEDIAEALYDICDSVHASCYNECPVHKKAGGILYGKDGECLCFKDGKAMLAYLRGELA